MSHPRVALGGHLDLCTACGFETPAYNSCRNRHCPRCQALNQACWIEARLERILPVHYFHLVFTLPSELPGLAHNNRAAIFARLFRSAADALLTLAADPKCCETVGPFHERWEIELAYHEIKTEMLEREETLRSKAPDSVAQELRGILIACKDEQLPSKSSPTVGSPA